jgi:methionyl-tRNA formyltransferase
LDKIKVLLLAMTGFGNNALEALLEMRSVEVVGVLMPKARTRFFPYYRCEQLQHIVKDIGISALEIDRLWDKKTKEKIRSASPDLMIVATFSKIIPQDVISIPRLGVINIHPSLLPKYRGATPTVWALINGETETGVTAHFIENEKIDSGRIISQVKLKISSSDTDGYLRYKLGRLSKKVLKKSISLVLAREKKYFLPQNETYATSYPKRTVKDAEIDMDRSFKEICNRIRAVTPYPGAKLRCNGREYIVDKISRIKKDSISRNVQVIGPDIVCKTKFGLFKFRISKNNIK